MISKELHNSDFIFYNENLMTDVLRIIIKYHRKIIAKYRHLLPSGNRALLQIVAKMNTMIRNVFFFMFLKVN